MGKSFKEQPAARIMLFLLLPYTALAVVAGYSPCRHTVVFETEQPVSVDYDRPFTQFTARIVVHHNLFGAVTGTSIEVVPDEPGEFRSYPIGHVPQNIAWEEIGVVLTFEAGYTLTIPKEVVVRQR
jgi:hypothetical protein